MATLLVLFLLGSAGCAASDQRVTETGESPGSSGEEQPQGDVAGDDTIELPEPEPMPVYGNPNREVPPPPPPAWLVVGDEAVQASYR